MPRFFNESIQYLNRKFNTLNFVHSTACVDQWRGRPGTKVGFLQQSALVGIRHNPGPRFDGDPTTADAPTPGHASQVVDLDPAAITEESSACSAVLKQGLLSQVETHLLHSQVEQARVQGSETYETDFAEARLLHPGWFLNKPVPDDAGTLQHLADLHKRNIAELQELRSLVQNMPDADFRAYYGTSFPDSSVSGSAQADTFQTTIVTTNNAAVAAVLTALAPILPASRTGPLSNMPDPFQVTSSLAGTLIYYQMIYNREEAAYFVRRYKNVIQQLRKSQAADFTSSNVAGQTLVFHGSTTATNYTQHQAPAFEKDLLEALAQSKNPTELPTNINTTPFDYFLDKGAAATFIEQKLLVLAGRQSTLTTPELDPHEVKQYLRMKTTPRPPAQGRCTRNGKNTTVVFSIVVTNPLIALQATSSAAGHRRHPALTNVLRGLLVSTGPAYYAASMQQATAIEQQQERTLLDKRKLEEACNSRRQKILKRAAAPPAIPGLQAFAPAKEIDQVLIGLLASEDFAADLGGRVAAKRIEDTKRSIDQLHKSGKLQAMDAYQANHLPRRLSVLLTRPWAIANKYISTL